MPGSLGRGRTVGERGQVGKSLTCWAEGVDSCLWPTGMACEDFQTE